MIRQFLLATVILVAAVACGGNVEETAVPAPTATVPAATVTVPAATATSASYPVPSPEPTLQLTAYPPPTPVPDPYPDGTVSILRPWGSQCEDESTFTYANLDEAVDALASEGVEVLEAETVGLMVCEACGCPTSEHFRVLIQADDLATAQPLGWTQE